MRADGWSLLLLSWGAIGALVGYCTWKLLRRDG
jgi:hypothetical protein